MRIVRNCADWISKAHHVIRARDLGKNTARIAPGALTAGAVFILVVWELYLWTVIPAVSRADFLLATWHRAKLIERQEYLGLLASIFEIFGGHIVAYTRIFQIFNYVVLDLSTLAIKLAAMATYVVAWWSAWRFTRAALPSPVLGQIFFAVTAGLLCSPVVYGLISWPESVIPYYSAFIAVCLTLPKACKLLEGPLGGAAMAGIGMIAAAVIIGSGVGWSIIPTLVCAGFIARGQLDQLFRRRYWPLKTALLLILVAVVAVLAREAVLRFMEVFESRFFLDDARSALSRLFDHPGLAVEFFFATVATNVLLGSIAHTYWFGVLAVVLWLGFVVRLAVLGCTREFNAVVSLGIFGVLSVLLTALTRWELVLTHGLTMSSQYYSVFALPFHMSVVGLGLALVGVEYGRTHGRFRTVRACTTAGILAAVIVFGVSSLASRFPDYVRAAEESGSLNRDAVFGAQNWNLMLAREIAGVPGFVEMYLFGVMPDLAREGKYPVLTDAFISDPDAFLREVHLSRETLQSAPPATKTSACLDHVIDGRVALIVADNRERWGWPGFGSGRVPFVRFVGYAIDPRDCAVPTYVLATDASGNVLCVSRPGREMVRTAPPNFVPVSGRFAESVYDFSCPLAYGDFETRGPYRVFRFDARTRRLAALPFDDSPTDLLPITGTITEVNGAEHVFVNGVPVTVKPAAAGWLYDDAGRASDGRLLIRGWAIDREHGRTAEAILVYANGTLVYAAEPAVPEPAVDRGLVRQGHRRAGFRIEVPLAYMPNWPNVTIRVFALDASGQVGELHYPPSFRFRPPDRHARASPGG